MVLLNACDSLANWTAANGTQALDTADKVEGIGSIKVTGDGVNWWPQLMLSFPTPQNLSTNPLLKLFLKTSLGNDTTWRIRVGTMSVNGMWEGALSAQDSWEEVVIDLTTPQSGTLDLANVAVIAIYGHFPTAVLHVDNIRAEGGAGPQPPTVSIVCSAGPSPVALTTNSPPVSLTATVVQHGGTTTPTVVWYMGKNGGTPIPVFTDTGLISQIIGDPAAEGVGSFLFYAMAGDDAGNSLPSNSIIINITQAAFTLTINSSPELNVNFTIT